MKYMKPLTQKARGIVAIQDGCRILGLRGPGSPLLVIPGSTWDPDLIQFTWPMFARPCPFRPRHGFVDSILVDGWEDVVKLLQSATEAGIPDAVEIVLVPFLTGQVSAVATNVGVTWGRGNDGVTSGSDPRALVIPVKTSTTAWEDAVTCMMDDTNVDFKVPEFPYLELVENTGNMHLVQLRDGPEQPEGVNHIIRKIKVQRVLKVERATNLLEWETLVFIAAQQKGSVIWAPHMSLASHYCVHGIASGVPVITDHEVKVGDVIQPTKNTTSTLGKRDYAKVAALIIETLKQNTDMQTPADQKHAVLTAIATTQAQFCWGKEVHLLRLRGLSIAVLLKAVMASCAGEIRHWPSSDGPQGTDPTIYGILDWLDGLRYHRENIYKNIFGGPFTFAKVHQVLLAAKVDLNNSRWTRSFGGPRWGEVADTGIALTHATRKFCARPCAVTWANVVQKANRLINTSHNNGKCLTKWVDSYAMTMISLSPTAGFLNPYVAQVALKMTNTGETS